jgi:hypothetical protein
MRMRDPDTPVPSTVAARPRSSVLDRRRQPKAGHVMADEPILDAGYALFFDAALNEPLLDLELVLALYADSEEKSAPKTS